MRSRQVMTVLLAIVTATVMVSPAVLAQDAIDPPDILPVSPLVISAYSVLGEQPRYVEIYNTSNQPIKAADWSISLAWSLRKDAPVGSTVPTVAPFPLYTPVDDSIPYIPPGGYIVAGFNGTVTNALSQHMLSGLPDFVYVSELRLGHVEYRPYVRTITETQAIAGSTMRLNVGTTGYTTTYGSVNSDQVYQDKNYYYAPSGGFPLAPIEILSNPKSCSPLDDDSRCLEYVKFYNNTSDEVDFSSVRLRVGSVSTQLSGAVASGDYAQFSVSLPNTGGYVSLEDIYGLHTYDNTVVEYPDGSAVSKKRLSWALIDGVWQWTIPNPGGANTPLPPEEVTIKAGVDLKPCRSDQYRNPETNRCKQVVSSSSALTPCAATQYRNPETNRCKSISSSSSTSLTPCAANQYRNPETNRCKSIASTASQLQPCAQNQVRNPETNRCRSILSSAIPTADFPVESEPGQSDDQSLGWVAFAGVGLIALGYAGWEWRYEIVRIFRTLKRSVTRQ